MELTGRKVVVLVDEMYNELELWYPYYRLIEAGAEVRIAGRGEGRVFKSKVGLPAAVQADVAGLSADGLDGIVIPGGYAPDHMRRYPEMVGLVKDMFDRGKVVAAICHAGWMLASADILKDRTVTSFFAIKDDLIHAGAKWVDEEVVVDGNLVTSRTPEDLPAFMRAVIGALK